MNLIMELFMLVSGLKKVLDMEEECKFGEMGQNMKATGRMIWLMEKEDLSILMVMYMRESGQMTKLMEEVSIYIWMEPNTMENGKKTNNMDMDKRPGQMGLNMKAIMNMVRNMVLEPLNGPTPHNT